MIQATVQISIAPRFWIKVKPPLGIGECWEWLACKSWNGYGLFGIFGMNVGAHRVAFELIRGNIPDGKQIDHLCRNRACVNPYHMEIVTLRQNILRGIGTSAMNAKKTHCPKGHPLEGDNLLAAQLAVGQRSCKICANAKSLQYYQKQKPRIFPSDTECFGCGKKAQDIRRYTKSERKYNIWKTNGDTGLVLCFTCYRHIILNSSQRR